MADELAISENELPPVKKRRKEVAVVEEDGEESLTTEERNICQQIMVYGVDVLRNNRGWKPAEVTRFLERADIQSEIRTLKRQYEDRTGVQERTQFFAQLKINSMVPAAINVLAMALRGEGVDSNGIPRRPPTKIQYEAALEVLDRSNVQGQKYNGNDSTPAIDARSVNIAVGGVDAGPTFDAEARERVRNVLSTVLSKARAQSDAAKQIDARLIKDAETET